MNTLSKYFKIVIDSNKRFKTSSTVITEKKMYIINYNPTLTFLYIH